MRNASQKQKAPPSIDVPAKSAGDAVREIGRALIYSREGHGELGPHLATFAAEALRWAPHDARLGFIDTEGDWVAAASNEALARHVASASEPASPERTFMIGDLDRTQYFTIEYHGTERGSQGEEACWLSVVFPRTHLYGTETDEAVASFKKLLATLPFSSATLGLALVGSGQKILPLQRKYRALDVAIPSSIRLDLGDRVAGVGWLTALGERAVDELGGADAIAARLGQGVLLEPVSSGVLLRLGQSPTRGDLRDDLSAYEAVATMLADEDLLHVPRRALYMSHDGTYGQDFRQRAVAAQNAWHLRFVASRPKPGA